MSSPGDQTELLYSEGWGQKSAKSTLFECPGLSFESSRCSDEFGQVLLSPCPSVSCELDDSSEHGSEKRSKRIIYFVILGVIVWTINRRMKK